MLSETTLACNMFGRMQDATKNRIISFRKMCNHRISSTDISSDSELRQIDCALRDSEVAGKRCRNILRVDRSPEKGDRECCSDKFLRTVPNQWHTYAKSFNRYPNVLYR